MKLYIRAGGRGSGKTTWLKSHIPKHSAWAWIDGYNTPKINRTKLTTYKGSVLLVDELGNCSQDLQKDICVYLQLGVTVIATVSIEHVGRLIKPFVDHIYKYNPEDLI